MLDWFQSTPAIADGRTDDERLHNQDVWKFQSTPAIADGRTLEQAEFRHLLKVSIHARHR